ncbi:MAG: glycosyltransferase N-terminal domain-containing protein [Chlorobiaceae bacterium]
MNSSLLFVYTLLFPVFERVAQVLSILHPKLHTFFLIRKGLFEELEKKISKISDSSFKVWIHATSVGEFEQARPIIAALKEKHPDIVIFISFFSNSGYNARKNFPDASAVFYLPSDTKSNAKRLISLLKPNLLLLMRYDFWPNHLKEAKRNNIRLVLAAAVLQQHAPYFKPLLKSFYQSIFQLFDCIYTASAKDTLAFRKIFMCQNVETAGDPRFDQVCLRSGNTSKVNHLNPLFENQMVLVAGSVWQKDEAILLDAWQKLEKKPSLILVPHEVGHENMIRLSKDLQKRSLAFVQVSALSKSFNPEQHILIIDQIGYLAELYSFASIAYVGGGFGVNVHNTLEPAVFGIPILFGPNYHNSPEAEDLVAAGGASVIHDQKELASKLNKLISDSLLRKNAGNIAKKFVKERSGATVKIVESIEQFYFNTKGK